MFNALRFEHVLTEILLTVGFVRLFNRELVEEKLHHQKLELNLALQRRFTLLRHFENYYDVLRRGRLVDGA